MGAGDLGLGEPEEFEPDSRAESIRQRGIGVVSVMVIVAAVTVIGAGVIAGVIWVLTFVLPFVLGPGL